MFQGMEYIYEVYKEKSFSKAAAVYGPPSEAALLSGNHLQNNTRLPVLFSVQNNIYIFYIPEKALLSTRFDEADVFYK